MFAYCLARNLPSTYRPSLWLAMQICQAEN